MTYMGRASHVITLAHELGHAYHSWVMRDLPNAQRNYGMSLAETASTLGKTWSGMRFSMPPPARNRSLTFCGRTSAR